eukprot:2359920-Amphidinium_carterae.1
MNAFSENELDFDADLSQVLSSLLPVQDHNAHSAEGTHDVLMSLFKRPAFLTEGRPETFACTRN